MVNKCCLVFPNQLFKESKLLKTESHIFLIEEYLFFKQYKFHKQKISFHRATMKFYEDYLKNKNLRVTYINSYDDKSNMENKEEEVIYSEGEPFEGYLYPKNIWDSDDSMYEEDYSLKSGWI